MVSQAKPVFTLSVRSIHSWLQQYCGAELEQAPQSRVLSRDKKMTVVIFSKCGHWKAITDWVKAPSIFHTPYRSTVSQQSLGFSVQWWFLPSTYAHFLIVQLHQEVVLSVPAAGAQGKLYKKEQMSSLPGQQLVWWKETQGRGLGSTL